MNQPWIFVGDQLLLHIILQVARHRTGIAHRLIHYDERLQRHALVRQLDRKNGAFAHGRIFEQATLHLDRVDPLPGNLDQVVGAASEKIKSVPVADEAIAGVHPAAARKNRHRGFPEHAPEACRASAGRRTLSARTARSPRTPLPAWLGQASAAMSRRPKTETLSNCQSRRKRKSSELKSRYPPASA